MQLQHPAGQTDSFLERGDLPFFLDSPDDPLPHRLNQQRHADENRHVVLLHILLNILQTLREGGGSPAGDHQRLPSGSVGVVIREEGHVPISPADPGGALHGVYVIQHIVLTQHDRLRPAGGAGSEDHDGCFIRIDEFPDGQKIRSVIVHTDVFLHRSVHFLQSADQGQMLGIENQHLCAAALQRRERFLFFQSLVQRDGNSDAAQDAEVGENIFVAVFAQQCDPPAGPAPVLHGGAQPVDLCPEFPEGYVTVLSRRRFRRFPCFYDKCVRIRILQGGVIGQCPEIPVLAGLVLRLHLRDPDVSVRHDLHSILLPSSGSDLVQKI